MLDKQGPIEAAPGQTISYTLTIDNTGGSAAQDVTLTDTLPTHLIS